MTARQGRAARSVRPRQSEKDFEAAFIELAELLGWHGRKDRATNAPRRCGACGAVRRLRRNDPGLPDLMLIRRPRLIWVELKAADGVVSPEQTSMIAELRACGQMVYTWRPSDWPEIERVLAR